MCFSSAAPWKEFNLHCGIHKWLPPVELHMIQKIWGQAEGGDLLDYRY